ncbi:TetR/AcrR family transcriptional regulator [Glycomyces endophyticus]|uniref:TetR/AcrR family transcriptional regulator n=1 Tax=Glycomyces endophyticus TaxID=480996 RepID=A0ABP4RSL2_9ACTN
MRGASGRDPERSVELLWAGAGRGNRAGLSLERIVQAGVAVADAEGLGDLTMQKVADRLGFTAMSLYRHVPGREHLIDLMYDHAIGADPAPEPEGGWRPRLEACARRSWQRHQAHPWLAEVRGNRRVPGPNTMAVFERMLSVLADTGLRPNEVVAAAELVGRFVDTQALTLVEAAEEERGSEVSNREWWEARDSLYAKFDRYPTVTALWEAGGFDDPEDPFEFGLRRVLDGLELLIRERDEISDEITACQMCGAPVRQTAAGRRRAYCSRACQQRAYRRRRSS